MFERSEDVVPHVFSPSNTRTTLLYINYYTDYIRYKIKISLVKDIMQILYFIQKVVFITQHLFINKNWRN